MSSGDFATLKVSGNSILNTISNSIEPGTGEVIFNDLLIANYGLKVEGDMDVQGLIETNSLDVQGPFKGRTGTFASGLTAGSLNTLGALNAGSANVTNGLTAGSANVTNSLIAGSLNTSGGLTAGSANVTGSLTAGSINTNGALTAGFANLTGSLTAGSAVITNGLTAGSANVTNALTAGSANVTNALIAGSLNTSGGLTAGSANVTGPLTAGSLNTTGDLTANGSGSFSSGIEITGSISAESTYANSKINGTSFFTTSTNNGQPFIETGSAVFNNGVSITANGIDIIGSSELTGDLHIYGGKNETITLFSDTGNILCNNLVTEKSIWVKDNLLVEENIVLGSKGLPNVEESYSITLQKKNGKITCGELVVENSINCGSLFINGVPVTKGDKGDKGVGIDGQKGDKGLSGPTGPTGSTGPTGPTGDQGLSGPKGDQGLSGPKGDQGLSGPKGDQGLSGSKGDQGLSGQTGSKGDQGLSGQTGSKGDQGLSGQTGPKGDAGSKGDSGTFGLSGTNYGDYIYYNNTDWVVGGDNISLGTEAGEIRQGINGIAIGFEAGSSDQGNYSVAIGYQSGTINQGLNSIAIGYQSGTTNQPDNSIILSADPTSIRLGATGIGFFVNPLNQNITGLNQLLQYNAITSEISYSSTKTFVINHPVNEDKYLVHACLEGPEAGVYYRGKAEITDNESLVVNLPEYVDALASEFTVQVSTVYDGVVKDNNLLTSEVKDNSFTVYGSNRTFFWHVHGKREEVKVEPLKSESDVKGSGPYLWI